MKKKTLKRALALALSMVMCVGMLQVTAFAEESDVTTETESGVTDTGVEVEVEKSEPVENEDGSTTESWTASGEDENGVTVEIDGSTTTKDTPAETDDDGNVTEPGKTETTERVDVTLTEKGEEHVQTSTDDPVSAPTEKEDMATAGQSSTSVELKGSGTNGGVTVSADIGNGHENNTREDHKEVTIDYDAIKDQVEGLKPDTSDWGDRKTDDNGKAYWEQKGSADNEVIRKTIEEITDTNGNVIGYKTITETIQTTKGTEYVETGKTESVDSEGLDPVEMEGAAQPGNIPTEAPALPEKPQIGDTVGDETVKDVTENEDGYTVTYEKVTGDPVSTPRVDAEGKPVLDEDGQQIVDLVYPTETRTETFKREEFQETHQVKVEEERKDTVVVNTVVDVNKVNIDNATLRLDLKMDGPVEDNSELTDPDGNALPDYFDPAEVEGLQDYLDKNTIGVNFLEGAMVTVEQKRVGSNDYEASATIKLNLNKSQLNDSFVLSVNGVNYYVPSEAARADSKNVLEFDENGNVKNIVVNGVTTGAISLQLTGKQEFRFTGEDIGMGSGEGSCTIASPPLDNRVDLSAKIHVTITEIKGDLMYEQFKKEETKEETKTFERTDTVTENKSSLTTVIADAVAGTKEDTTTQEPPTPVTPPTGGDDPTPPTGGDDGDDTPPVVDVPDTDVPLVEEPVIDVPDEEVPLVDVPDEDVPLVDVPDEDVPLVEEPVVEIPDEEVPLAEEVVILDGDVPLADVPKTGDISSLWYLATLLSACGLAVLTLRKKEG